MAIQYILRISFAREEWYMRVNKAFPFNVKIFKLIMRHLEVSIMSPMYYYYCFIHSPRRNSV